MAKLPVADRVPIAGVPTGPRDFSWRPTEPATLVWAEALDGGDWNVKVPARDKVMTQKAPFTSPPTELLRTEQRFAGFDWGERPDTSLLHDYDENKHWSRTYIANVDDPKTKPRLLFDMSSDEHYKDPGNPVYRVRPDGQWVMRQDGHAIFLSGEGATPDGVQPFLDRKDLATGKSERLFHSAKDGLEYFLAFTHDKGYLTWHQSPVDPPNAMLRTFGDAGAPRAVTHIPDPTPAVRAIKKRLVKYTRKDGTSLSFTLYTPPGYQEGARIPAILYAYPLDYASTATAGQNTDTDQVFTRLGDYRLLLLKLPLLIMHGAEDANPGTTPLQAVKLYEALRGNGGTARLVMLPHEPHWYSAMESNEQLAYEELRWFDRYVKNALPKVPAKR